MFFFHVFTVKSKQKQIFFFLSFPPEIFFFYIPYSYISPFCVAFAKHNLYKLLRMCIVFISFSFLLCSTRFWNFPIPVIRNSDYAVRDERLTRTKYPWPRIDYIHREKSIFCFEFFLRRSCELTTYAKSGRPNGVHISAFSFFFQAQCYVISSCI